MSLFPTELPFNLGSAQELPTMSPRGLTSLLPVQNLPFTLSAKTPVKEIPYGSVGWELVCRSYSNFQTEIFRTSDVAPPAFSKELSGTGLASVTFDLDHYLFNKLLVNGRPVEDLFDYENLWEIYFDKKLRFQFLGTAVKETPIDSNEIRSATVSGNGIAQVLSWASVYPPNFPEIIRKVETLRDDFSTDRLNTVIWNMSSVLSGGIDLTRGGQKEEILQVIEKLTADRNNKVEENNQQQTVVNQTQTEYNNIHKDKTSTAAEKRAITKELSKEKALKAKLQTELNNLNAALADANLKSSLAPALVENDSSNRARLTVNSSGDYKILSAGQFEFESSGVSARIEPLPQGTLGGQARTTFGVHHNLTNWAYMYTALIGTQRRIVCEVVDNSLTTANDFSYDPNINKYWRVREDHNTVIFDTSADSETWTEHFRVSDVSWTNNNATVSVLFKAELQGNAGTKPPLYAYIAEVN